MTTTTSNEGCAYLGTAAVPCGCAVVQGRSYCETHLWRVYQKGTAVHRRKDARRAAQIWDLESELNRALEELEEEGEL